jgi:hypothetical protein
MILKPSILCAIATGLICAAGISPCAADLPMIQKGESLGYFIAIKDKNFKFGINTDGKAEIRVVSKKGDFVGGKLKVTVDFQVEQIMPDGKITRHAILPETLESTQPPAEDPKQTVIRGKVKGNASIEITAEKGRNGVLLGGRVVDPGTLTANPIRFSIVLKTPDVYEEAKKEWAKNGGKGKEAKLKEDGIELVMADRKKVKVSTSESIDASTEEFNGPGIIAAEITLGAYHGKAFELAASPNSSLVFSNTKPGPLHDGFSVKWTADIGKDPNGTSRISIAVK